MLPHVPQLLMSCTRSTQPALQLVRPDRHTHAEPMQAWVAVHAWPQVPQSFGLVFVSTQTLPLSPAGHEVPASASQWQVPPVQTSPWSQAVVQLLQ
jgi:hypothetical protein